MIGCFWTISIRTGRRKSECAFRLRENHFGISAELLRRAEASLCAWKDRSPAEFSAGPVPASHVSSGSGQRDECCSCSPAQSWPVRRIWKLEEVTKARLVWLSSMVIRSSWYIQSLGCTTKLNERHLPEYMTSTKKKSSGECSSIVIQDRLARATFRIGALSSKTQRTGSSSSIIAGFLFEAIRWHYGSLSRFSTLLCCRSCGSVCGTESLPRGSRTSRSASWASLSLTHAASCSPTPLSASRGPSAPPALSSRACSIARSRLRRS